MYFARPATTGDQRWDAMVAANAEDLSLGAGLPAPAWIFLVGGAAMALVERFYGPARLGPQTQLILEDLLAGPSR